jgi:hypothetical protein
MLDAAIITSAGYPEEAAEYLFRAIDSTHCPTVTDHKRTFVDFYVFVSRGRALHMLEDLYRRTNNYKKMFEANLLYLRQSEALLAHFYKLEPTRLSNFLKWCSEETSDNGGLIPKKVIDDSNLRSTANKYVGSLIELYVRHSLRMFRAVAFDLSREPFSSTQAQALEASRDLFKFLRHSGDEAAICFQRLADPVAIETLEFETNAVHALLVASVYDDLADGRADATGGSLSELGCEVGEAVGAALAIARSSRRKSDGDSVIPVDHEFILDLRRLDRQLRGQLQDCA